ncbi:membrane protein [Rhodococcus erythropolis R138]|jgi:uncharacterized protein YlxW (UPF0749 family)|uniref:DUF881 domain-containing protein n=1 Tax=Rhodococcus TaxID=1827 RepID=UPI000492CA05|nr:DUF881 domain-containing protein [Rhodococcus erythropolis]ALU70864.1 membrane protein [Rhodococcus erythropolis R138]
MKSTGEDVRRNPVPSLLRSLMTEHLDPGYEATAFERQHEHTTNRSSKTGPWLALGALLIGFIVAVSAVQATKQVTGTEEVRSELVAKVRDAEDRIDSLAASRDSLGGDVDAARGLALEGDARGSAVLDQLRAVESGAGAEAVHGEGLVVTLTDPAGRPNLSDASQRSVGGKTVVLDRDLQTVVNALWAGGAEAIAVGGVRIGPTVTIRQAGGAMLVDNQPVFSPYRVEAIGDTRALQREFVVSDAYVRMSSVSQLYGVGFAVAEDDSLTLPPATPRAVRVATEPTEPK